MLCLQKAGRFLGEGPDPDTTREGTDMDKELNALRRVAKAAKLYQDKVIQKRSGQLVRSPQANDQQRAMLEIGSAEFELSEALNEWYRTQAKS